MMWFLTKKFIGKNPEHGPYYGKEILSYFVSINLH